MQISRCCKKIMVEMHPGLDIYTSQQQFAALVEQSRVQAGDSIKLREFFHEMCADYRSCALRAYLCQRPACLPDETTIRNKKCFLYP